MENKRGVIGLIQAVVFDWDGTVMDYGAQAPVIALKQAFAYFGIQVPLANIRLDQGLNGLAHTKKLLRNSQIGFEWLSNYPDDSLNGAVEKVYQQYQRAIGPALKEAAHFKPGVKELVDYLNFQKIPYIATTKFPQSWLAQVLPLAAQQGFHPKANVTFEPGDTASSEINQIVDHLAGLSVTRPQNVIRIGDMPRDMLTGQTIQALSVGVVEGGQLIGLSEGEFDLLTIAEKNELRNQAVEKLEAAGADEVINQINELINLIVAINDVDTRHAAYQTVKD
ncbi:HAD family hydrolase [Lentilactobacillus farraginis]|uniref:(2-aminoethyl)phosphonate--pyruvate aminotransferase n=1 Tax=Lentilactobacillus farraginis DSM 18382 = JCM 14108 TaxID=1423743 RepID=X0PBG3_9LACO|nr:HAD family hydrolase [Lentilactobacillus farraginis]KRM02382.1 (2-aminoethyl)phosphonate--pyruvate aminotransferase [Lentilactobacillus farraginis DSM 18382 = JCM 14108]GAF37419.1 phosphonoacetaldehyde hydrolase [Lentilactobacillus farraginis DSM 18382 = JCM 14108]